MAYNRFDPNNPAPPTVPVEPLAPLLPENTYNRFNSEGTPPPVEVVHEYIDDENEAVYNRFGIVEEPLNIPDPDAINKPNDLKHASDTIRDMALESLCDLGGYDPDTVKKNWLDNGVLTPNIVEDEPTLAEQLSELAKSIVYKVEIVSSGGQVCMGPGWSSILFAIVHRGNLDVTAGIDANRFKWTRVSNNDFSDAAWNAAHFGGTKTITITHEDAVLRSTFKCEIMEV